MELTEPQRRELRRVRETGHSKGKAGYSLRIRKLTEFIWKLRNGKVIGDSQVDRDGWYDQMQGAQCVGERVTSAGFGAMALPKCQCEACQGAPHASCCAVHNAPALPIGPCDCGAAVPNGE